MSPCARGAISRFLRFDLLRSNLQRCPRQLTQTRSLRPRIAALPINTLNGVCQRAHQNRYFSTTRFQRDKSPPNALTEILPIFCPGCGAFSQTIEPHEPGYYSTAKRENRKLIAARKEALESTEGISEDAATSKDQQSNDTEEHVVPQPMHGAKDSALPDQTTTPSRDSVEAPDRAPRICDRCHDLIHHNKAVTSPKPSIFSIREFLAESPYKNNRVYHIIDAADFPMSLVPRIQKALSLQEQRSHNRRSHTEKYSQGQKLPTLSFIITRSDLLAATKEQVDSKMEYVRSLLRENIGRAGRDARLGNVHMISAHRGWWTKQLKEEIRKHGGGIWVVGKANVGKSSFIEACFPKDSRALEQMKEWVEHRRAENEIPNQRQAALLDPGSLLPPAPREGMYPMLPVVSSLPGTTGEVIDLPGLERGQLEDYVRDEHKRDLIMTKRIKPERYSIRPGQSLLLGGGLVRITAVNLEDTIMAACFVPIDSHITKTEKAIEIQAETRPYSGTLMKEGTGSTMSSAGKFELRWDVTNAHLPTSLAKAVRDKRSTVPSLPYRVMSADILIEGCGWIEVSVQIRSKQTSITDAPVYPQVEVFTPNGQHIGSRPPMECWAFVAEKNKSDRRKTPRLKLRRS
ncbi:hypothetical protein NUU61_008214 [Penicillium alfredii]|uniref:G domain-containing protein n=1 Tax=Penicillium alfredii TaxID=1506179 RepID=A0A9W9ES04_9EURO|nr:uncharacterized protein NUU61_008214 [Penicillium alfredii]KAJ5086907.1 hypothetical protein NUU61_008214 [Penicillium alfredii]